MIRTSVEIIGLVITVYALAFFNFKTSLMKALAKAGIAICFFMILKVYIKSLGFENEGLFLFMKLGLLLILFPMLCQFE